MARRLSAPTAPARHVRDGAIELRELGVTAIEIMPVGQFPGGCNWGHDGVLPYATQNIYGGPHGLARLVDACHATGLAVVPLATAGRDPLHGGGRADAVRVRGVRAFGMGAAVAAARVR